MSYTPPEDKMELKPQCFEKVMQMVNKGVNIPNPLTLDIGAEVNIDQISSKNVTIYPGCRIYGEKTVISSGAKLGYEGPVTIEDCQIGQKVELKGGFFSKSVFLDKSNMGLGAQVREGCILEEEAGGAHCVGLKQTILFPFVTLGSLINFCDCLMAGGTSRKNHSEVGSSYIHFNFTPDGDKTTPSLIGDVPRGVMVNQPPIFLGGQGGMVGPLRIGYGNVVAAGSVLRSDYPEDNMLIIGKKTTGGTRHYVAAAYPGIVRIIENNILYIANLTALEQWYIHVRKPFLARVEFGMQMFNGLIDKLSLAKNERLKRLEAMAERAVASSNPEMKEEKRLMMRELSEKAGRIKVLLNAAIAEDSSARLRDEFLTGFKNPQDDSEGYIETIKGLSPELSGKGTRWLNRIVDVICEQVAAAMPALGLFGRLKENTLVEE
jgi:bifunctional UDP-N-acetylglucosamine pyrophosphorylase / glucosamine-1-phosphate N-acetyltransferase